MQLQPRHNWDLAPQAAIALQKELATQLVDTPLDFSAIRHVAGVDVSVKNHVSQAAVVVLTYPDLQLVETVRAQLPTTYPYIPGLLTFREGEVLVNAFKQLQIEPDVFMFDGMGRIHPRRMGIAAHLGLWLDKPTIGCGKTHFIGTYTEPQVTAGSYSPLLDNDEQIGVVLRTRTGIKPVYISAGHRTDIQSALTLTLACTTQYRLPQPIRHAHNAAGQFGA
jgi:deoxyribonuclease V